MNGNPAEVTKHDVVVVFIVSTSTDKTDFIIHSQSSLHLKVLLLVDVPLFHLLKRLNQISRLLLCDFDMGFLHFDDEFSLQFALIEKV